MKDCWAPSSNNISASTLLTFMSTYITAVFNKQIELICSVVAGSGRIIAVVTAVVVVMVTPVVSGCTGAGVTVCAATVGSNGLLNSALHRPV